jgi:hypothetical protein
MLFRPPNIATPAPTTCLTICCNGATWQPSLGRPAPLLATMPRPCPLCPFKTGTREPCAHFHSSLSLSGTSLPSPPCALSLSVRHGRRAGAPWPPHRAAAAALLWLAAGQARPDAALAGLPPLVDGRSSAAARRPSSLRSALCFRSARGRRKPRSLSLSH